MQVFLSWSGERSKRTAEIIRAWLKMVIQALDPWMSPDIEKGKRWGLAIAERLDKSKAGIICLDKDNFNEKWILFEAGALSKSVENSYSCIFLLDVKREDIESPLADFQNTIFEKEDMRKLVHTLNSALSASGEKSLDKKVLDDTFDILWPQLEKDLKTVMSLKPQKSEHRRTEKEILVEILEIVRSMNLRATQEEFVAQLVTQKELVRSRKGLSPELRSRLADELISGGKNYLRNMSEHAPSLAELVSMGEDELRDKLK